MGEVQAVDFLELEIARSLLLELFDAVKNNISTVVNRAFILPTPEVGWVEQDKYFIVELGNKFRRPFRHNYTRWVEPVKVNVDEREVAGADRAWQIRELARKCIVDDITLARG